MVNCAQDNDASEEVLDQLQAMPKDTFEDIEALNESLYKLNKLPGNENLWSSADSEDIQDTHSEKKNIEVVR